MQAAKRELGFPPDMPFALVATPVNMLDPAADVHRVIATIRAASKQFGLPVSLVVLDTLARSVAGGNENASEAMGAFVVNSDHIRHKTGAHVMAVHHSGKDAAKGARGHSSLKGAVDTEIELTRDEFLGWRRLSSSATWRKVIGFRSASASSRWNSIDGASRSRRQLSSTMPRRLFRDSRPRSRRSRKPPPCYTSRPIRRPVLPMAAW